MIKTIATASGAVNVQMTDEEIVWKQAWDAQPMPPLPIADQLTAIFDSLSETDQIAFAVLDAAVQAQVEKGRMAVAKALIQNAAHPDGSTLTDAERSIQTAMLAVFP